MVEKANPSHPNKIADRISGAIVDLAYKKNTKPKISVEVLIGRGVCRIIAKTSVKFTKAEVRDIVNRIAGKMKIDFVQVPQDTYQANNQDGKTRCGDNGIFKYMPLTKEQKVLSFIVKDLYKDYPTDGKYILSNGKLIACQSNANKEELEYRMAAYAKDYVINPMGDWTSSVDANTGTTNHQLISDMADSITSGGLHGKDLSKADVSVSIYAFLKAQKTGKPVELCCTIGDETIDGRPYAEIVNIAHRYIYSMGGFEKLAEWGLY